MQLEIWTLVVHFFQVSGLGSGVNYFCIVSHMKHQYDLFRSKECMDRFTENSTFDILLCKSALFRCKSSWTEDLKWQFLDSIHLLMCKSQYSSNNDSVVFFKIHWNSQKTKIRSETVQFDPSKVFNFCFLRIPEYSKKYHNEFDTKMLTFAHEKMYGIKKQSFQVLCPAIFAHEKYCFT